MRELASESLWHGHGGRRRDSGEVEAGSRTARLVQRARERVRGGEGSGCAVGCVRQATTCGTVRRRRGETRSGRTRDRVLAESRDPGPRRRGQTCGGGQRGCVRTQRGHSEAGLRSRPRARPGAPGPRRRLGSEEGVARHGRPCVRVPKGTARARQNAIATTRLGTGRGEVEARRRCEDRARATAKGHSAGAKAGFVPRVWVWPRPCVRSVLVCARGEGQGTFSGSNGVHARGTRTARP